MITTLLILAFLFIITFGYLGVLTMIVLGPEGGREPHPVTVFVIMFLISGVALSYGLARLYS